MKKLLLIASLSFFAFRPAATVYVCDSGQAYAYHQSLDCSGIKHCKHDIIDITEAQAISQGKRKCKICYR